MCSEFVLECKQSSLFQIFFFFSFFLLESIALTKYALLISALKQTHFMSHVFSYILGLFECFHKLQTLTWTTSINIHLQHVPVTLWPFCMYACTHGGNLLIISPEGIFVKFALNFTQQNCGEVGNARQVTVTRPQCDQTWSCWSWRLRARALAMCHRLPHSLSNLQSLITTVTFPFHYFLISERNLPPPWLPGDRK